MYLRPRTLDRAVEALAQNGGLIIAGGTDVFPAHVDRPLPSHIVDVSRVDELRGIVAMADEIRIGGAVRWSEIIKADLPPIFDGLKAAAREVGSIHIQNRSTIAGNLCNASPAADSIPPLLALDAQVELVSVRGARRLSLAEFMTGYRQTALQNDEILAAVIINTIPGNAGSAFLKLGSRKYLVISIIMVAAVASTGTDGRIDDLRIAVGAASTVAQRLRALEYELLGTEAASAGDVTVLDRHLEALRPIDDVRASASYRLDAAKDLVARALAAACRGTP